MKIPGQDIRHIDQVSKQEPINKSKTLPPDSFCWVQMFGYYQQLIPCIFIRTNRKLTQLCRGSGGLLSPSHLQWPGSIPGH
jgi:hypothetical protein